MGSNIFSGLSSLTTLDISNNNMIAIASGTFAVPTNLVSLYVQNNQFLNLSSSLFSGLTSLSSLGAAPSCNTNGG